jgi:hypothetical protein
MNKQPRKKKLLVVCLSVLGIISIAALIISKQFGTVKRVVCKTQFGECPQKYSQVLSATTDPAEIESVLSQLPDVKTIEFRKTIGNTLDVFINIRTPLGVVNNLISDDSGMLFGQNNGSSLPSINSPNSYEIGQTIDDNELKSLKILSLVTGLVSQRFSSKLTDNTLFLTLDSGLEIVINVESEDIDWSSPLQHILARSKIDGKAPRRIDLRFKNPVITF